MPHIYLFLYMKFIYLYSMNVQLPHNGSISRMLLVTSELDYYSQYNPSGN